MSMPVIVALRRFSHGQHFRAIALRGADGLLDPFIGVDHAWMGAPTFGLHPHAGLSAVSYLFLDSATGVDNRDSIGTHNLIRPGGLHWTAAGRGIEHEEVPVENGQTVHSLQIFVDLGPDHRERAPSALSLEPEDVPQVLLPGARVRVPAGQFGDARSPLNPPTAVTLLDIALEPGAELVLPVTAGDCAFVMPIAGTIRVDGQHFAPDDLRLPVFPARDTPHHITLQAPHGSAQAMLFAGRPLHANAT
ncbi:pirin family protein [Pseudomonas sp. NPDC089530]|uniref:pirin family protein n=1 Tax=Pseudomonas sp. NPDC089530 TaxID=3390651 RepID=UPI003D001459